MCWHMEKSGVGRHQNSQMGARTLVLDWAQSQCWHTVQPCDKSQELVELVVIFKIREKKRKETTNLNKSQKFNHYKL